MIDLSKLSIRKAHEEMKKGRISALELTRAYLKVIEEKNPNIHAYLEIFDDAEKQAEIVQEKIKDENSNILTGIPFAMKDNILIEGRKVTAASHILEGFVSPYDSTVTAKLRAAGVIFLGRTNMDEFAMGSSTENSSFGVTRNPIDTTRVPGGSSGGSAAAIAMNGALAALGSDTGGSVRQPASFCGCVGLKPTYGSVSRYGLMALGSSLDQIGPITKTVDDSQIIFNAIRGKDPLDSTSFYPESENNVPKKIRVGVPTFLSQLSGLSQEVSDNFRSSLEKLNKLGFEIVDVNLPNISQSLAVYYILMPAEASSNLARFDGVKYGLHLNGEDLLADYLLTRREGFGKEVRRRIMLGTYVLSAGYYDAYYGKANAVRSLISDDFKRSFTNDVDVIVTPTTPTPAFKIGEKVDDPLQMYLADIFTVTANITSNPAISVPSGFAEVSGEKLPLGLQIFAPQYREDILFHIGKKFLGEE